MPSLTGVSDPAEHGAASQVSPQPLPATAPMPHRLTPPLGIQTRAARHNSPGKQSHNRAAARCFLSMPSLSDHPKHVSQPLPARPPKGGPPHTKVRPIQPHEVCQFYVFQGPRVYPPHSLVTLNTTWTPVLFPELLADSGFLAWQPASPTSGPTPAAQQDAQQ